MKDLKLSAQGTWVTSENSEVAFNVEPFWPFYLSASARIEIAERIAACVNACAGYPTTDLKDLARLGGIQAVKAGIEVHLGWLKDATTQRDELLMALEELSAAIRAGRYEDPGHDRIYQALLDASAVIARAKGGETIPSCKDEELRDVCRKLVARYINNSGTPTEFISFGCSDALPLWKRLEKLVGGAK